MKFKSLFALFLLFSAASCQQIIDNYWDRKAEESYVSPYKGIYIGTYSGSDQGTLRIEITSKDYVEVTRVSTMNSFSESFQGGMIGPAFNKVRSRESGFMILGEVSANPQNSHAGTWKIDDGNSGTWTVKKQ